MNYNSATLFALGDQRSQGDEIKKGKIMNKQYLKMTTLTACVLISLLETADSAALYTCADIKNQCEDLKNEFLMCKLFEINSGKFSQQQLMKHCLAEVVNNHSLRKSEKCDKMVKFANDTDVNYGWQTRKICE